MANVKASDPAGPSVTLPRAESEAARQASEHFAQGDYQGSARICQAILRAAPNDVKTLCCLGAAQFRVGKLKAAEGSFRHAARLAPGDPNLSNTLGVVFFAEGKLDQAISSFEHALALDPQNLDIERELQMVRERKLGPVTYRRRPNSGDFLTPLEQARLHIPPPA